MAGPLSDEMLARMDAYWRASNYLSVGQIYLRDNPLLEEPLQRKHIKPRLLGHWGTTTGLNFIYVHLNRLIVEHDLNMIYVMGPGHGGPGPVAHSYLEGSYTERYPHVERNRNGLHRLFRQFSWPYGIPSHVAPETPGSIHEGGELGYSLVHAYGAAFDNPDLIVACVIGDGEAETGPLAASWHSNKFLNPRRDGAVLPILHLNGFKIANPTVLARIPRADLVALLRGYGYEPHCVEGDEPAEVHQALAAAFDAVLGKLHAIQGAARAAPAGAPIGMPRWPMVVLRTPKGWTGPKVVDGLPVEGTWRAHQVPLTGFENPDHVTLLQDWMLSYRPRELFDENGKFREALAAIAPTGHRRMSANPHANGGELLSPLLMPHFRDYGVKMDGPGTVKAEATRVLGRFLRDVFRENKEASEFPGVWAGRDGVEPARCGVRGDREDLARGNRAGGCQSFRRWTGDGGAQRASVSGLAGRVFAHRTARAVFLLRGVHPHRGFDGQPARQMAEEHAADRVAQADRIAQLFADVARLAAGS